MAEELRDEQRARIGLVAGPLDETRSHRARRGTARRGSLASRSKSRFDRRSRIAHASLAHRLSRVVHRALLDENRSMSPYLWRLLGGERDSSRRMRRVPTRYDLRVTVFFTSDLVPRRCADNVAEKLHAFVRVTCLRHPQGRR
jgi:hypothetical protein